MDDFLGSDCIRRVWVTYGAVTGHLAVYSDVEMISLLILAFYRFVFSEAAEATEEVRNHRKGAVQAPIGHSTTK